MERERVVVTPPAGWTVMFYADVRQARNGEVRGASARVVGLHASGQLDMNIERLGELLGRPAVRHISDPWHDENPNASAREGGWDWHPAFPQWLYETASRPPESLVEAASERRPGRRG